MDMRKQAAAILVSTCAILMAGIPAMAQDVTITGDPCVFTLYSSREEDAETTEEEVSQFRLFGRAGEDFVLIRTGEEDEYIRRDELEGILPELDLERFPDMDETEAIAAGSRGDAVLAMQQTLADLGYLTGVVDGIYGPGTTEALRKFQEAVGLEVIGTADIYTVLLLTAIGNGIEESVEVSSKGFTAPEEKFPQIAEKTEADLAAFMEPKWRFRFDPFTDQGEIDPGIGMGFFDVEAPAIDRIHGELAIKVMIIKNKETGMYDAVPAIVVQTEGAYRPYLQGAILTGEETVRLENAVTSGELNGVSMKETGCIPLTVEAVQLLKEGKAQTIRLLGRNNTYDVEMMMDGGDIKAFMEACETIS